MLPPKYIDFETTANNLHKELKKSGLEISLNDSLNLFSRILKEKDYTTFKSIYSSKVLLEFGAGFKDCAKVLREEVKNLELNLSHGQSLEILSKAYGYKDYNTFSSLVLNNLNRFKLDTEKDMNLLIKSYHASIGIDVSELAQYYKIDKQILENYEYINRFFHSPSEKVIIKRKEFFHLVRNDRKLQDYIYEYKDDMLYADYTNDLELKGIKKSKLLNVWYIAKELREDNWHLSAIKKYLEIFSNLKITTIQLCQTFTEYNQIITLIKGDEIKHFKELLFDSMESNLSKNPYTSLSYISPKITDKIENESSQNIIQKDKQDKNFNDTQGLSEELKQFLNPEKYVNK